MLHFLRKKPYISENGGEQKQDRRDLIALLLLAVFVGISLWKGIGNGSIKKIISGFRFHFFDGAAIIILTGLYLIFRNKGGKSHDK